MEVKAYRPQGKVFIIYSVGGYPPVSVTHEKGKCLRPLFALQIGNSFLGEAMCSLYHSSVALLNGYVSEIIDAALPLFGHP